MEQFSVGQRWVSAGELHLGVGLVLDVEFRTVSIIYPATGETRLYAKDTAPLSRVEFAAGDTVSDQDGLEMVVERAEYSSGLLVYYCVSESGEKIRLSEGKLNNYLKLNQPVQRLLNGQVDKNKWFELRAQTQKILSQLSSSDIQGLAGCRTSLIEHQLYIAHEVAGRYAPRVLLADEVGLGKTIEAGLIIHQQLLKERAQRVLIVVPETLLHQWLVEMMRRFNLLFSVFDEDRCLAVEGEDSNNFDASLENPFHSEQLVLCSLEFLSADMKRFQQSLDGDWDMLVVDEAHHLVWEEKAPSIEYQLIEKLSKKIRSVLLLTATPEQLGKESHFARLRLLDSDRFSDLNHFVAEEQDYQQLADVIQVLLANEKLKPEQLSHLLDTTSEGDNQLQIEQINDEDDVVASGAREKLVEHLLDRHGTGRVLFRNTRHTVLGFPLRQLKSYALTCPEVYTEIYQNLEDDPVDLQWLLSPEIVLQALSNEENKWGEIDPRVDWLIEFLQSNTREKVLVICSTAQTALSLVKLVKRRIGISLAAFHEGLSLIERDKAAAWFADMETGTQALICSEIGSEGRNFQFAHHLVMFDLPFNPDLLEQRIGRLDRIGQSQTIKIHVPFLKASPQQVMLNWLHQGLNAFEQTCPAGHSVFMHKKNELIDSLRSPHIDHSGFIDDTMQLHLELNEQMKKGRDRLLEYNSCRPEQARILTDRVHQQFKQLDLPRYIESLYDCYGISYEIQSPGCWVLHPTDNMLAKIPGFPEEGMTVTYDRDLALANEDVRFLTWEHPLVRTLMDMVQSSELGNTALLAIKYRGVKPGTLLLDCFFRIEIADTKTANGSSEGQRYLPENLLRLCIDEKGQFHQDYLSPDVISRVKQMVDIDTSIKIIRSRDGVIKALLGSAESKAKQLLPQKQDQAYEKAEAVLKMELERLKALQTINPNVRDEEIEFFQTQLASTLRQIDHANIRLDAIRVFVAV